MHLLGVCLSVRSAAPRAAAMRSSGTGRVGTALDLAFGDADPPPVVVHLQRVDLRRLDAEHQQEDFVQWAEMFVLS